MFVIKNEKRNAFKTYDGWTRITRTPSKVPGMGNATLDGLNDVMRFTSGEAERNKDKLPNGCRFVHFPSIRTLK